MHLGEISISHFNAYGNFWGGDGHTSGRGSICPALVIRLHQIASSHFLSEFFTILFLEQSTESQNLSTLKKSSRTLDFYLRDFLSRPDAVFKHLLSVMLNGEVSISNM